MRHKRTCNGLTQELAALRDRLSPQDAEAVLLQREENEILRQKIKEIGAAVIRAASSSIEATSKKTGEERLDRGYNLSKATA